MTNIYQTIYDLVATYIFGGSVDVGTNQELVTMLLATCACIFVFALPFVVVWKVMKLIIGG